MTDVAPTPDVAPQDEAESTRAIVDRLAQSLDPILSALRTLGVNDASIQADLNNLQARL